MVPVALAFILAHGGIRVDRQVLCRLPGVLIGTMLFGPAGRQAVCAVHLPSGGWAVLEDGRLIGTYDGADPVVIIPEEARPGLDVTFSVDGRHYAFVGTRKGRHIPVIDGEAVRQLVLSRPNAKHFYFRTETGKVGKLYVDGVLQPFDGEVAFSPDERHFAVMGRDRASVDGILVFADGSSQSHLFWDNATTFHGYAMQGDDLVRIKGKTQTHPISNS